MVVAVNLRGKKYNVDKTLYDAKPKNYPGVAFLELCMKEKTQFCITFRDVRFNRLLSGRHKSVLLATVGSSASALSNQAVGTHA